MNVQVELDSIAAAFSTHKTFKNHKIDVFHSLSEKLASKKNSSPKMEKQNQETTFPRNISINL